MACKWVHAFDLSEADMKVARQRCDLLGLRNTEFFCQSADWPKRYLEDPSTLRKSADIIICYALLEHLLPMERIIFLVAAWKHLPIDGYLVVGEAPNRLYWFDWHSSQMPFIDQLPPEFAYLWNATSQRNNIPKDIRASTLAELESGNFERLYRFGRGVSFHEFYTCIGPDAFEVAHTYDIDCSRLAGWNPDYVETLRKQLAEVRPPVDPTFAQPRLDLILRKVGPGILA
jgi:S-adenosylmethionine-dependent methyltransferase